ncbi:hypothetical protein HAX54_034984, partial [Datura stramonium]|nr:hypothetical protein [Datura stramonium]
MAVDIYLFIAFTFVAMGEHALHRIILHSYHMHDFGYLCIEPPGQCLVEIVVVMRLRAGARLTFVLVSMKQGFVGLFELSLYVVCLDFMSGLIGA